MPRTIQPHRIDHHGNERWRVLVPVEFRGNGPAKRIYQTEAEAKKFCREMNQSRGSWGQKLLALSDDDQGRLVRAIERAGSTVMLEQAVEAWARTRVPLSRPIGEAAAECVESKREAGRSWQYVENLSVALRSFCLGRESRPVSEIAPAEIETWLNGNGWSASTRLTYIRRLETFWSWCAKRAYAASDPTAAIERPTLDQAAVVVLSVRDCERVLRACRQVDPGLLPYFAIGLFAGVRPDELKRLQPENIKGDWIEVEAAKSKTRRRRLVEIHPTLRAWLDLGGEIGWMNWRRRWRAVRDATGADGEQPVRWVSDILRHTFCSYAYPIKGAHWTSMHAGHSEQTLFRHYRERITESAAREFWALSP